MASDPHHSLGYWARSLGARSARPAAVGRSYAASTFGGFERPIRQAAVAGCVEGIRTVEASIRFLLDDTYTVGETIDVRIENTGTLAYRFQAVYAGCFLEYLDSAGRRFIIPPGTHCDILIEEKIGPGEVRKLFTWSLDECVKGWGCARSRPLPPGTYTVRGVFKPKSGGTPARAEKTFRIVPASRH